MALILPPLDSLSSEELRNEVLAKFFRGLGDPSRLRILKLLLAGDQPVGTIVKHLRSPQGRVSSHLACLRWCGYVTARKEGRQVFYSLSDSRVRKLLAISECIVADNEAELCSCLRIDTGPKRKPWKPTTS